MGSLYAAVAVPRSDMAVGVTLEAAIEAELPFLRREAEAMMTLTLTAYSPDPEATTTDANGYEIPAYNDEGTTPGRITGGSSSTKDSATRYLNIGGVERPVLSGGLHLPIGSPIPVASEQRGQAWEYEVSGLGTVDNPALMGRRFMVVSLSLVAQATALRLDVIEL